MKIILIILLYFFLWALFSALFKVYVFDKTAYAEENAALAGMVWIIIVPIIIIILLWYIPYVILSKYLSEYLTKFKK